MFWCNGRFGWPVVLVVVFSTVAVLAIDLVWRSIETPFSVIALAGAALLLVGNAAILAIARKSR